MAELLDHQPQVFDTRSARVEFFGLLGQRLALRIELCLEPPDLFVVGCSQRCLLLNSDRAVPRDRVNPDPAEVCDPWTQYAITSSKCKRGKPASIQGNHDDHQTATSGVHVRSTRRQSMPSRSIESCARLRCTVPLSAFGQMNRPRSRRLANRHKPSPSHHRSFTMSPRRPRNTNTCPENGCSCNTFCTCALKSVETAAQVRHSCCNPDLGSNRKLDHLRRLSRIERTRDESAPLSTLIVARPGSSMWIAPVAGLAAPSISLLSSRGLPTVTGTSATLGSLSSPRSNARRHLNTWFAFTPWALRNLGDAGARLQRQLHNLKLL